MTTNQEGLLVQYDVLLFDEIDKIKKSGLSEDISSKLYQYLASGKFDRGTVEKTSECGIMMVGNLPSGEFDKNRLLENALHETNTTAPFLDRLAGVVSGWEIKSIGNPNLAYTKNFGFAADYFSEILHKLRRTSYQYILNRVHFENITERDSSSINKIISGMIKLVYPNGEITDDELDEIVSLAVEYRQFVVNQNFRINREPTFDKIIEYRI
ncbi:MAG: BREX system Lon protease-like protein BrxL [Fusobacteriaceae bacterium]